MRTKYNLKNCVEINWFVFFFFIRAGKIIVLKDDDTDVETNKSRGRFYRRFFNRPRKQRNDTDNENNVSSKIK